MSNRKWSLVKLADLLGRPLYSDYKLKKEYVWIDVGNLTVRIKKEDEGVVADIFPIYGAMEEPIASTYAFYNDAPKEGDQDE